MILQFMRHPAIETARQLCIGQTDAPLSSEGKASVEALADSAAELKPERIICSSLTRCRILAEAITKRISVPVEYDPEWREIHFGAWENRRWDDIREKDFERFEAWTAQFDTLAPPEGESFLQLQRRTLAALGRIDPKSCEHLLIITHAGVIRALLCALQNRPNRQAFDIPVPYGSFTTIEWPLVGSLGLRPNQSQNQKA